MCYVARVEGGEQFSGVSSHFSTTWVPRIKLQSGSSASTLDAGPKLLLASRRDCGGFSTVSGASNTLLGDVLCSEVNGS